MYHMCEQSGFRRVMAAYIGYTESILNIITGQAAMEAAMSPGNSVSRIGQNVREFIKRAVFALQKYFCGVKAVF